MQINEEECIVQEYLHNPLLINNLKFDLRIYVLVTSYNPLRIYVFKEGLVRLATGEYKMNNLDDIYSHLTNYSINKNSEKFKQNQDDFHYYAKL